VASAVPLNQILVGEASLRPDLTDGGPGDRSNEGPGQRKSGPGEPLRFLPSIGPSGLFAGFRRPCENQLTVPLPQIEPMPLAVLSGPFDHSDWIFELKYDGFRASPTSRTAAARWCRGRTLRRMSQLRMSEMC
jgi:hypothetical protein